MSPNEWLSNPIVLFGSTAPSRSRVLLTDLLKRDPRKGPIRRLNETVAAFLARYEKPETRRSYAKALHPFAQAVGTHYVLDAITPEMLDIWYRRLCASGLADATIASRTKMVKAFWNWCVSREYIAQSPARFLRVKACKKSLVSKAIPSAVLASMFDAVQHKPCLFLAARDTAILALLITFGARVGDVAHLTLSHVFLEHHRILFHVKGGKEHLLPLPYQTGQHLAAWLAIRNTCDPNPVHDYVFVTSRTRPGNHHTPLATGSISTMIRRLSLQVCGKGYGPHSIRHWRGQTLADQRVAPTVVQAILGHSNVRITLEHYYNQDWHRVQDVLRTYELGHNFDSL